MMNNLQAIPRIGLNLGPDGEKFPWGPVVRIHEVGDFQIVESRVDYSRTFGCRDPEMHGKPSFHPYYLGRSMSRSSYSLDGAIVEAIAIKYDGCNTKAADYFWRVVGETPHPDYTRA